MAWLIRNHMRKSFCLAIFLCLLTVACSFLKGAARSSGPPRPNVLFVFVDDLRPDLGCYGNKEVVSPYLDAFARESAVFTRQYVTVPTCGASRYSLLTGKLPATIAQLQNSAFEKLMAPNLHTEAPESFVDLFRRNGYRTIGVGKISHAVDGYIYPYDGEKSGQLEMPQSWDEMLLDPGIWKTGWNAFFGYADGSSRTSRNGNARPYESGAVEDEGYIDGLTVKVARDKLDELSRDDKPFFLGVGLFRPHLPFSSPAKYWELYDEEKLSLTPSPEIPQNVNPASLHVSGEFNSYKAGDEKPSLQQPVSDAYARKLRHAYYASVSYTDAQIGKLLQKLKALGLEKNTVVVIWGDHGWHLGDHRVWGKHTIFERGVHSVLMVKSPGMKKKGVARHAIVSSIDIYPTLVELCNLPRPEGLDGRSFTPLLRRPDAAWDNVAYSYFNSGISVRNDRYRYTRYFRSQVPAIELFDHQADPYENTNIAEKYPDITTQLDRVLEKGNTRLYDRAR